MRDRGSFIRTGLLLLALSGCAAPLGPLSVTPVRTCEASPDTCFTLGRAKFDAYRKAKLDLIAARGLDDRAPGAPFALLHPRRTRYAALLVHGLNDSAYYMKDVAEVLYRAGMNVITVLLPGHGTDTSDMTSVTAESWREEVQTGLSIASLLGDRLLIGGMSLGGALSIDAARRRDDIRGLVLFVPALRFRSYNDVAWLTCSPLLRPLAIETAIPASPIKYKYRVVNGVCQTYRVMRHNLRDHPEPRGGTAPDDDGVRALAASIHVPTFVAFTYADVRVSPRAILEFAENIPAPATIATFGTPDGFSPPAPGNGAVPRSIAQYGLPHSYLVLREHPYNGEFNPYFEKLSDALTEFLKKYFVDVQ
jgi:alpha-beta hydrolase superfamily lysophospholipase